MYNNMLPTVQKYWRRRVIKRKRRIIEASFVTIMLMLILYVNYLRTKLFLQEDAIRNAPEECEHESKIAQRFAASDRHRSAPQASKTLNKNYGDLQEYGKLDPSSLNNTMKGKKLTLVFNRVPKVGSMSMMELMHELLSKNDFVYFRDIEKMYSTISLSTEDQQKFAKLIDSFPPPSIYVKHVRYVDFSKFNYTQPIYFNMVRDPVERVISWFYYIRTAVYIVNRKEIYPETSLPSMSWISKDYETCVKTNDSECQYIEGMNSADFSQLTDFFCGQEQECKIFNSKYALQKAKENVEKNYAVVGILEDMNMTLTVLEHYIPRFFAGAKDLYWNQVKENGITNKNKFKPTVSEEVKDIVRKNFTREIEFFEFCRQRLHMQFAALKLS